jgi:ferritin-like metal-binding protein YciE
LEDSRHDPLAAHPAEAATKIKHTQIARYQALKQLDARVGRDPDGAKLRLVLEEFG